MTTTEILAQLAEMGSEQIKNIFQNHGALKGTTFGVKIGDLKTIQKKLKKNHALSLELYDTGNSDAMYLAGLIADEKKISKAELKHWMQHATWGMQSEYTVPWVAAESDYGMELAQEWIESENELMASGGWATFSSVLSLAPNEQLDMPYVSALLDRVENEIHTAPNRVRYSMNGFVIAVGCYVPELTEKAKATARAIGKVTVNMGKTACKVPDAETYITKVEQMGKLGRKKKMARC